MPKMMKQCGLTVASRSDSGVISSSVSESALSASDTAAPNSANYKKLVLQTEFDILPFLTARQCSSKSLFGRTL